MAWAHRMGGRGVQPSRWSQLTVHVKGMIDLDSVGSQAGGTGSPTQLVVATHGAPSHVARTHNRDSFFGTETLGTMPTFGDSHSSNFGGNIVSSGSNHPPPIGSAASDIGSVFPTDRWGHCTQLWSAICIVWMKRRFLDRILHNGTHIPVVFTMYQILSLDSGVFAWSGEISPHLRYLVFSILFLAYFGLRREISLAFGFCVF